VPQSDRLFKSERGADFSLCIVGFRFDTQTKSAPLQITVVTISRILR
jgi:hypothetical protein